MSEASEDRTSAQVGRQPPSVRGSAERWRGHEFLDDLLEGCQVIGFDWRYLYLNEAATRHARRTREELLGRTVMEMYPGIEETAVFAVLRRTMEQRTPANLETEFTFPDGTTRWFELRIEPVPEGLFVLSLDISPRKLAQQAMEHQIDRLKSLRAIDLAILGTTDLRLALKAVLEETKNLLQSDAVAVLLFEPTTAMLEVAASTGFRGHAAARLRLRLGSGASGRAAFERRTVVIPDLTYDDPGSEIPAPLLDDGIQALCAAPLVAKGQLMGVLAAAHRAPFRPDPDWLDFLEALADQTAIAIYSAKSFETAQRANQELSLAYETTIEGWSRALDLRDKETEGHTLRVTEMTLQLARMAGMTEQHLVHIRRGALLHDIGKMGVPDAILLKPDQLTDEEWEFMRKHPTYAYELLFPIEYLRPALDIPYCHHEKWDGTGYPRGLKGEQIPLAARLFAVVDVWDALRSDRPYRPGWPEGKVLEHIRGLAGTHLDPRAVELFWRLLREGTTQHR